MRNNSCWRNLVLSGVLICTLVALAEGSANSGTTPCIIALDPTAAGSLTASGNTTVTANCGVAVNSMSADAVDLKGIASIALSSGSFSISGGFDLSGAAQLTPTVTTGAVPIADPLANLQPPSLSGGCDFMDVVIDDLSSTLNPGVYCNGIQVSGHAVVTLNAGIYILQGGGLTLRGNSTLAGTGVALYDTGTAASYGPIIVGHNATVQLAAPTTGPLAGVLFFGDRSISSSQTSSNQTTNIFGAAIGSTFNGALYFPTQTVLLQNFFASPCSLVIAAQVEFAGDSQLICSPQ